MSEHIYRFQVLETHLDTFGHMNHAMYLTMFEEARWDWITGAGYGLAKITESQIGPTILEVNIKYKKEIFLREHVTVHSRCTEWSGKLGRIHQKMLSEKGEVFAEIDLLIGVFDMNKRRLVTAPDEWLRAIGRME
jgi:thioesterase III